MASTAMLQRAQNCRHVYGGDVAEKTDYVLTNAEAAVLAAGVEDAMAEAGARGGAIGGAIGGGLPGAAGGRRGGAAGGRFGVRFTKPQTAETTVDVAGAADGVRDHARAAIAELGSVIEDPNATDDGSVWGLIGSGVRNMSPALVRVEVRAQGEERSRVHVRATGREGLVKQKIAAKAADRIADAITHAS